MPVKDEFNVVRREMESMLSLLAFVAAFSLMMRFGCGAHLTHHHRFGRSLNRSPAETEKTNSDRATRTAA
jgi:hypothetical protein